jgi:DNA-binding PadR family transcriptional regulator
MQKYQITEKGRQHLKDIKKKQDLEMCGICEDLYQEIVAKSKKEVIDELKRWTKHKINFEPNHDKVLDELLTKLKKRYETQDTCKGNKKRCIYTQIKK